MINNPYSPTNKDNITNGIVILLHVRYNKKYSTELSASQLPFKKTYIIRGEHEIININTELIHSTSNTTS